MKSRTGDAAISRSAERSVFRAFSEFRQKMAKSDLHGEYLHYHALVNEERRAKRIPVIRRDSEKSDGDFKEVRYVREDGLPLTIDWWETRYPEVLDPILCEAFSAMSKPGAAESVGADAHSSIFPRIYLAWGLPSYSRATPADVERGRPIEVCLGDDAPMLVSPALTREEWETLREAVLRAAAWWEAGETVVVHCARGPSGSVLCAILLFLHLHAKGADTKFIEGTDMEKVRCALLHVNECRPGARLSSCWYSFCEFLGGGWIDFATLDLKK